ncbi:hypothetical protein PsorP6_013453 [Peronosclerospora sorghi]|uniref:Uncharacterized protein n=1 Tax=Peronosclerospora sorghi TaxID=230839 RepID=A0ACC0VK14_9STRA|nr:hypothetical protein PsorP6_013453 [Peronosclerospora sorghi]
MEFDLNVRSTKWNREQRKRRDEAKRKVEAERQTRVSAEQARHELEILQKQKRLARLAELERHEQQALDEHRLTGGITYARWLKPFPTIGDGDKITLPASALAELNPQNAFERGVFTFELSFRDETCDTSGAATVTRQTHAGVLEFVAEEGSVGLPPKVAASLFRHSTRLSTLIHVRFVRLEKGKFVSLQPRGAGFGKREMDLKELLERSLKTHTTLTEGDIIFVRHGRETFEVVVSEIKWERAVNIVDTDLEVNVLPCEAAQEVETRFNEDVARAMASAQEKEQRKASKTAALTPEPSVEETLQVTIVLRMPEGKATRRFLRSTPLRCVFDFLEAFTGEEDAQLFVLVTAYPRRVLDLHAADKTLEALGLRGSQETLFVERLVKEEGRTKPVVVEEQISLRQRTPTPLRTMLPEPWETARQKLEQLLDTNLSSNVIPAIHAMEPAIPIAQSTDLETKWAVQLRELEEMGFRNRSLNIQVLERYQGRLLRAVNYLSEIGTEDMSTGMKK